MYLAGQGFSVRKLSHNFPLTANSVNNQLTYKDQVLEDGIVLHVYSEPRNQRETGQIHGTFSPGEQLTVIVL